MAEAFLRSPETRAQSGGMAKMPTKDAKIIPPNTGVPTSRRAGCEAPTATTSG